MVATEQTLATGKQLDMLCINTIRTLAMDGVQQANSGHPGAPMALAPVTYSLWQQFLRYDPADPVWPNRDRFILSNGHASMLLYAMLYLAQVRGVNPEYESLGEFAVTLDDIKRFRQLDSKTPGHPEYRWTAGVETTTGPLGQGVGNSVGMAIAGKWLAAHFNQPGFEIFDYNVYALCGDGDMMEGVASEAASLAGHLKLSNLCWIYDENHVTLDGLANVSFTEDVGKRFEGYGWNVEHVTDANDLQMLADAYNGFLKTKDRPTLIRVNSHIGYGSPHKQDTSAAHGEPLGEEEVRLVKKFYGWPEDAKFLVPDGVLEISKTGSASAAANSARSGRRFRGLRKEVSRPGEPDQSHATARTARRMGQEPANVSRRRKRHGHPREFGKSLERNRRKRSLAGGRLRRPGGFRSDAAQVRRSRRLPGGQLRRSQPALWRARARHGGRVERHGGFEDPALRRHLFQFQRLHAALGQAGRLMEIPTIYVWTHDSIGLGEDGPTHQPIEQLASLRAMPGLMLMRPADANEVVEAWKVIMAMQHEPAALVLSRQGFPPSTVRNTARRQGSPRVRTSWPTPPTASRRLS